MPLLLSATSLYSACTLKSLNFARETRLFALAPLVIAPSTTVQPMGLEESSTPHASSDLPSNNSIAAPYEWAPFAFAAGHVGGRAPVHITLWPFSSTEPRSKVPS